MWVLVGNNEGSLSHSLSTRLIVIPYSSAFGSNGYIGLLKFSYVKFERFGLWDTRRIYLQYLVGNRCVVRAVMHGGFQRNKLPIPRFYADTAKDFGVKRLRSFLG